MNSDRNASNFHFVELRMLIHHQTQVEPCASLWYDLAVLDVKKTRRDARRALLMSPMIQKRLAVTGHLLFSQRMLPLRR